MLDARFYLVWWAVAFRSIGVSFTLEVALDPKDSGFFLRYPQTTEDQESTFDSSTTEAFTLLSPSSSATVKAWYGPFSVKQTVLPALLTPSSLPTANATDDTDPWSSSLSSSPLIPAFGSDLDISAHLVTHEIQRDRPVLRVLFHSSRASDSKPRPNIESSQKGSFCVALYAHYRGEHLLSVCSLGASRDGVCLAEITLPSVWWPPLESGVWRASKQQKGVVRLEYALLDSHSSDCSSSALPVTAPISDVHSIYLGDVTLSSVHGSYEEIKSDNLIRILVPQGPAYPRSKVYVPVYLMPNPAYPVGLYVFEIRARVKSGLRILGAQASQPSKWKITLDLKAKDTVATVTAFVNKTPDQNAQDDLNLNQPQEVFTWLLEVEEEASYQDSGRVVWQLRYTLDSKLGEQQDFDEQATKLTSRLDIQKDDVQAVLPIAKSTQLLNTAVLTSKQVSQPMKVFVVSQAGKVGDVTLQSSCHAADESILKVSPSCTSVYLDGSEIRGSQNASVLVKYGTYTGQAHFLVWMPELPLEIRLSDNKLSQIKSWKTPRIQRRKYRTSSNSLSSGFAPINQQSKADGMKSNVRMDDNDDLNVVCRLRYQQTEVFVYTKFFSVDHNSGREAYLLNRRVSFRVTELVAPYLRVADSRIASLKGNVVQGQESGRTEVQVLSPITGRVIGAREIRVGSDKETITHLEVTVVTGLHLAVFPDENIPNVFTAQTTVTHKLTSQYQEGLLDVRIHFSDGTVTTLASLPEMDYHLSVDSFDSGIVAFAPVNNLHHPRVIAIGQGKGELLHVSLELSERCQKRRSQPMSMAYAFIEVDFSGAMKTTSLQNDAHFKLKGDGKFGGKKLLVQNTDSNLYQDSVNLGNVRAHEPTVQARQNLVRGPGNLTPLEIGMFALLGVFCIAVLVCTVFAVRYRKKQAPAIENSETVAHAHDWVWLGRATLERNAVNTRCSQTLMPMSDFNGNNSTPGSIHTVKGVSSTLPYKKPISRMHRSSNISFPGSEISIRITTNPHQLSEEEGEKKENSLIQEGSITSLTNHNAFHLPSEADIIVKTPKTGNTSKQVRIQSNPLAKDQREGFSTFTKAPPVPPHRNLPPPPIPPHASHASAQEEISGKPRKEMKNANMAEYPLGPGDMGWDSVSKGMNYDQLMEYFVNLKESNA